MKTLLLFALLMNGFYLNAQGTLLSTRAKIFSVNEYEFPNKAENAILLETRFGDDKLLSQKEISLLKNAQVAQIDLLYTDYPKGKDFSELNEERMQELKKIAPDLFKNSSIKWNIIAQTNCRNIYQAKNLFHGFVITYRPKPSKETIAVETEYLKSFIHGKKSKSEKKSDRFDEAPEWDYSIIRTTSIGEKVIEKDTLYYTSPKDSTLLNVFKRNKEWKNKLIVMDVTGSMSPYSAQLFTWLSLNTNDNSIKKILFFNDGDMTPDNKKIIGNTGGIYISPTTKSEDIEKTIITAMTNGFGGDCPENNIEALIKGINACPNCSDVIMVADNWATPKDLSLVKQLKKPIHIILCGTFFGINLSYLNLARETGGSIHTMEQDLNDLIKMNEGEKIKIGKEEFMIKGGKFIKLMSI